MGDLFGSKPKVPKLPTLDLGAEAGKAITANQNNLPAAQKLVGDTNKFSRDQIDQMLNSVIPGYQNMVASATGNIASELKGEIPTDVANRVQDSAAARALGGGYAGSGAHGDLVARDLGLTSLNLTQHGLNSFENWTKTSASLYEPSMINVSGMFVSPEQMYHADNEQNVQQFQRQWMQNQIDAQPAMWAQAFKEAVQTAISMYSGDSSGIQHAGTMPVQGGVGSGGGYPYSSGAGEGGAGFDPYSTQFNDTSTGFSDYAGGGGMDSMDSGAGGGGGGGGIDAGGGGFGGFA